MHQALGGNLNAKVLKFIANGKWCIPEHAKHKLGPQISPNSCDQDIVVWTPDKNGKYNVAATVEKLRARSPVYKGLLREPLALLPIPNTYSMTPHEYPELSGCRSSIRGCMPLWNPPDLGTIKLNIHGVLNGDNGKTGGVFRDDGGEAAVEWYFKSLDKEVKKIMKMQLKGEEGNMKEMIKIMDKEALIDNKPVQRVHTVVGGGQDKASSTSTNNQV
ncbi:hypothetical protein GIB67_013274 [Kingdonia uniflora]|uniref:Uncharacterized protein n=1 Tax=Kingdonia uniflora TaxID=39325 RepID=A0A7J7N6K2_9MAGN|nr:hypothetical protein GIB67_013274 [Kingdonia uniflora]